MSQTAHECLETEPVQEQDCRPLPEQLAELRELAARQARHMQRLTDIGLALSGQQNRDRLLEMIVDLARSLTHADAGTLYIVNDAKTHLNFVVMQNDTMNTRMGGTSGNPITLPPVALYTEDGQPNHANVSSYAALTGKFVNIPDVYCAEGFDFTGPRRYDAATGYRSQSMLVMPMRNHESEVIGVLQLLNAKNSASGTVHEFSDEGLEAVRSLATQAAVALTNTQLIAGLKALLYSFMQSIAAAIDAKSPYTRGHIDRVVDLTMRIAETINEQTDGPFAGVHFTPDELEELKLAAWMHDVGKITTPVHVVDKSTKLETIIDRIEIVRARFKFIGKSMQAELLERLLELAGQGATRQQLFEVTEEMDTRRQQVEDDLTFIESCNQPGEFMTDERIARVREIAARTYEDSLDVNGAVGCAAGGEGQEARHERKPWLTENEVENLCIRKGSLTDAERKIIEDHAVMTAQMLDKLPFPKRLARVPAFAASHHEKLDGSGYPNHLSAEQLPLQSRILAVADIFEALTAHDRPYKPPMKLSQALKILGFMCKDKHIDAEVFQLVTGSDVVRQYAESFLNADQNDLPPVQPSSLPESTPVPESVPQAK